MTAPSVPAALREFASVRVVGAQARELARVRVSFDGPVLQDDPRGVADALNPTRYAITVTSAPAVGASITALEPVTSSAVDLLTDIPLTPGASYRLDVTGVASASGDVAGSDNGTASFTGFVPPRPAGRVFDLYRFLPELNRREDTSGDLRRFLACMQEVTELLLFDVDRFADILDPDLAPESVLDLMLGEIGSPFAFDLAVIDKRRLLNVLVAMYREKGTAVGITNAIRFFLGLEAQVVAYTAEALLLDEALLDESWVLGPPDLAAALAFEIVSPRLLGAEERRRLRQIVQYMKPAQIHFARLVEPTPPETIEHVEVGLSDLGLNWNLH